METVNEEETPATCWGLWLVRGRGGVGSGTETGADGRRRKSARPRLPGSSARPPGRHWAGGAPRVEGGLATSRALGWVWGDAEPARWRRRGRVPWKEGTARGKPCQPERVCVHGRKCAPACLEPGLRLADKVERQEAEQAAGAGGEADHAFHVGV